MYGPMHRVTYSQNPAMSGVLERDRIIRLGKLLAGTVHGHALLAQF
jgi:hypothetical protein